MANEDFIPLREVWPPGTVIKGDYRIERKLGEGGFGTVYVARHRYLETTHVIKRLHEQLASNQDYARKFLQEGRVIRRLKQCPYIVEVEQMTQTEDGFLILVMEYIAGGDLAGLAARRRLELLEVIEYGRQIALGLDAAHAAGLVHRDIKPANVMIGQDARGAPLLKLIDFGIAADQTEAGQHTTSMMRPGSVGFAAPEQWAKAGKQLDGRTDLYSLGATLYWLLARRMPYEESGTDLYAWIDAVKAGPPADIRTYYPECPPELAELIGQLLSVRPEGRPASAADVAARFQAMVAAWNAARLREQQAREQAERQAREQAERQAREQAERQAREQAERQAREQAEWQAREQAERQAREQAERQAREQAERQAREQAERQAREQAERQAREKTILVDSQQLSQAEGVRFEITPPPPPPPRWRLYAGAAAVVLTAGLIVWASSSGRNQEPPQPTVNPQQRTSPPPKREDQPNPQPPGGQDPSGKVQPEPAPRNGSPVPPPIDRKPEGTKKESPAKPKQESSAGREPEMAQKPDPPPPAVNHAALGDEALNLGDLRAALTHYRQAGDPARLARLQRAVEGDTTERVNRLLDRGEYAEAMTIVNGWLREFPNSQRLQNLQTRINRARWSQ